MRYYGYDGVYPIRDYAEAVTREGTIKPIRGNPGKPKPLGERKMWNWCGIKKVGESILCQHNGTDTTFHPDGTITLAFRYVTQCAPKQVSSILGVSSELRHKKLWIACVFDNGEGTLVDGWLPVGTRRSKPTTTPAVFRRYAGTDTLLCLNPTFPTVRKLNVSLANTLMKPFKPFLKYAVGMAKLHQDGFDLHRVRGLGEYTAAGPTPILKLSDLLMHALSEDPDAMHKAFMSLVAKESLRYWGNTFTVSPNNMRTYIQEAVFMTHASDELFIPTEIRTGKIVQNVYEKYMPK